MSVAALGWVVDRCLLPGSSALGVTYSQASEVLIVTILSLRISVGSAAHLHGLLGSLHGAQQQRAHEKTAQRGSCLKQPDDQCGW